MRFIVAMLLVSANTVALGNWVEATGLPAGSGIYIDADAISKDGDMVKMWDMHDLKEPERVGNQTYLSQKSQYEYDCRTGRVRLLYLSLHAGNMGGGTVVYASTDLPAPWRSAQGGLAEIRWKQACGKALPPAANPLAGIKFSGGDGSSIEQAVIINGAPNSFTGVGAEYAWLRQRYPGFKRKAQSLLNPGTRVYDRMDIETADGQSLTVYFDISEFYGKR